VTPAAEALSAALVSELKAAARPLPGVHHGVAYETYAKWPALRHSTLEEIRRSPAHARAKMLGYEHDTPATKLGSATHCAVLEPAEFPKRYAIRPTGPDGKPLSTSKLEKNGGCKEWKDALPPWVDVLDADEGPHVVGMVAALKSHPIASALLFGAEGHNECVLVWEEPPDGLLCMRRLDRMVRGVTLPNGVPCEGHLDTRQTPDGAWCRRCTWTGSALVELKTCVDARAWAFSSAAEKFGYFGAAWWSLHGAALCSARFGSNVERRYLIVAVESAPPYAVQIHEPTQDDVDSMEKETRELMRRYRECLRTNEWPAYPVGIWPLQRPAYARRAQEE
jgi:hypothetical protein